MVQEGGTPGFEVGKAIEQDIERLHKEITEKRGDMPEKEALHEAVKETISAVQSAAPTQGQQATPQGTVSRVLPNYVIRDSKEIQLAVEKLIAHAFQHGITKAAQEAKGQGAFFLDAFHDALVDKLYEEFKKRKLFT